MVSKAVEKGALRQRRPMARAWLIASRLPDGRREEPRTKFHFAQAVRGIRKQYSPERAQGKGDGFQKLICASTALHSKSESAELEAIPNKLQASLKEVGLEMHVGHNGGASKTAAMSIPAHGCSSQDGDTSNAIRNSGGIITFFEKSSRILP